MNKNMFWSGIIMQVANVFLLTILLIDWNFDLLMKVLLGSVYIIYNITSITFIIVGLIQNGNK